MPPITAQRGAPVLAVVAKNSAANLMKMAALSLTVFVLPPLLVRFLDKPTYATWVLILQIGTFVALIDGSIQSAVSRFVARARGLDDDLYLGKMLSTAGLIMLGAGLITAILTLLCSWQLSNLFPSIPPLIGPAASRAILIYGMSLAMLLPFSTLAGAFLGLQKNEVNATAGSLGRILGAAGAAWAAYRHQSLTIMALWIALGNLIQALLYLLAWIRLNLPGLIQWTNVTRAALWEFVSFCSALFATQLGGVLITGLDIPIVAAFDFRSAGYYGVATTVSTLLTVPQAAVVSTLMPIAASISATSQPERLGAVVIKTTRYSTALLCLLAVPLLLGMGPFLQMWVGTDYAGHVLPMAILLVIAQFIRSTLLPYAAIGFAAGQQHRMLLSPLGEGVVNLLCSLIGARYLGAAGVALGTLIGACVGVLLHSFNSMPRTDRVRFDRMELAITGILRPLACALPALALALIMKNYVQGRITQIALVCVGELLTAVALWRINFDSRERNAIIGLLLRFAHFGPGVESTR